MRLRLTPASLLALTILGALAAPAAGASVFSRLDPAAAARFAPARARTPGADLLGGAREPAAEASFLAVDEAAVAAFRAAGGGRLSVPDAVGGRVEMELEPYALFPAGGRPSYTDDAGRHAFDPDVSLFRGRVAGEDASWAVIAMSGSGVFGAVERAGRRWTLAPAERRAAGATGLGAHAFAPEGSQGEAASRFECGINTGNEFEYGLRLDVGAGLLRRMAEPDAAQLNGARFVLNLAVDCDYEIVGVKFGGNLTTATAYVLTVLGTVNLVYERDLEATLNLVYLNLWTTSADPYTQGSTSPQLSEFKAYWIANNGGISSHAQHLISGRPLGGGIAFLDAICSGNAYGVSAIDAVYSYPTATTTWDVNVIAHELGHNFGSPHTHSCTWAAEGRVPPASTIFWCETAEGSCATYTNHLPPNKGTIMSYCHLLGGVANGVRLEFHSVCVSRMRSILSNCGTFPTPTPPRNPIATPIASGVRLTWTASLSPGVLRYSLVRSRLPLDLGAGYFGHTTASPYDTPGLGTYYYRMRTVRLADSSSFSGEVKATACAFVNASPVTAGSQPTAAVSADFNEDDIQDVALVTTGGGNLVTMLGQGAGGVGNGTFGAASLLATLTFAPTGFAVADFDEDGIDDVVVAGGVTSLVMLRGQGTAGVPSGTFAAPVVITGGGVTRGVIAHDWNGDGITDLATTGTALRLLYGNGAGGRGDGTFSLGPSYTTGSTPNHLATGDLDQDGVTDLAVCNTGTNSISVYLGGGTPGSPDGTFATPITVAAGSGPNAVNIADWDHDGRPDLAVASNNTSHSTSVLLGLGNGTFDVAQTFPTGGNNPAFIAVQDFNEDGTPDLFACNRLTQSVTRQLAGCVGSASHAIAVTAPNGGEVWNGGTEHTLTWTKGAGVLTVDVQLSADGGTNWRTLASGLVGTSYSWTATGPTTAQARIRVVESHAAQFADVSDADFTLWDESVLAVDGEAPRLALLGAWPNPARADLAVALALPAEGSGGTLELLDLAGRRVASRDLAGLGPGRHRVALLERRALAPGVYLVRLLREGQVRSLKVAVLQ